MDPTLQVLQKIEKDNLQPRPRYALLLKRSVFWTLTGAALVAGSIAVSVAVFSLANTEWDVWSRATGSIWKYVFVVIPYFWLVIFTGFVLLAHYNLRHTKFGYRYSLPVVVIAYVAATFAAGGLMYRFGLGDQIEELLVESTSFYHHLPGESAVWIMPDRGLLGGKIISLNNQTFSLVDQDGLTWQVSVSGTAGTEFLSPGAKIKIIGTQFGTSSFSAVEIRSWCGCGGCDKQVAPTCVHATATCGMGATCGCGE